MFVFILLRGGGLLVKHGFQTPQCWRVLYLELIKPVLVKCHPDSSLTEEAQLSSADNLVPCLFFISLPEKFLFSQLFLCHFLFDPLNFLSCATSEVTFICPFHFTSCWGCFYRSSASHDNFTAFGIFFFIFFLMFCTISSCLTCLASHS